MSHDIYIILPSVQLKHDRINNGELELQIKSLVQEAKPAQLYRPCSVNDGILQMHDSDLLHFVEVYNRSRKKYSFIKFVPASGAATRMFKHIYERSEKTQTKELEEFKGKLYEFPFFVELEKTTKAQGRDLHQLINDNQWDEIFDFLLTAKGLSYGELPKGLIPFHQYEDRKSLTAFEEHLIESIDYATSDDGISRIHFTISPPYLNTVKDFISSCFSKYKNQKFQIEYSIQSESTDMPALNLDNTLFQNENSGLVFRPSGHGALIHNLQALEEDLIFIKNIDNVTTHDKKDLSVSYKKAIGGLLIELKENIAHLIQCIETERENALENARTFIRNWFLYDFESIDKSDILSVLNRPIRVCGMVKNQGEPGGGPFWVKDESGTISRQIVEKSQVNSGVPEQAKILSEAGFFNPVDIVCCIKDSKGHKFQLDQFIDYSTSFISEKNYKGTPIKAIELPGLWNGSMAKWNTVFVEVPIETFNPVKTVNDLLRPGHRSIYNQKLSMSS